MDGAGHEQFDLHCGVTGAGVEDAWVHIGQPTKWHGEKPQDHEKIKKVALGQATRKRSRF